MFPGFVQHQSAKYYFSFIEDFKNQANKIQVKSNYNTT